MKITKKEKVDAIFSADWHFWDSTPPCRTDDFLQTQINKAKQISSLQEKYNCPVYMAGDLTENYKASPYLISILKEILPNNLFIILGNHDLKNYSLELLEHTAVYCLAKNKYVNILPGVHWEQSFNEYEQYLVDIKGKKILFLHTMIWQGKKPWPGCTDPQAKTLFRKFPKADGIVVGHNHKTFFEKKGNQFILNPGSIFRLKADQIDHKPCVWLYNAETNTVKKKYLEYDENAVTRDYIEIENEENEFITEFTGRLNTRYKIKADFETNLMSIMQKNEIKGLTKGKIEEAVNG